MATQRKIDKKSELKRLTREEEWELQKKKKRQEEINKEKTKMLETELSGAYKRVVTDIFIRNYTRNYGETFDFNSLNSAFNFSLYNNNGLRPDFSFNEQAVQFESDFNKDNKKFNLNANKEFLTNQDLIEGGLLKDQSFYSLQEKDSYQKTGDIVQDNVGKDIFISNKERYSEFNKINKSLGYQPQNETISQSKKDCNQTWNQKKGTILLDIEQKIKKKFRQEEKVK